MSDPFREGPGAAEARRKRSLAIALGLVGFILLVFAVTLVQFGRNAAAHRTNPPAAEIIQ